MKLDEQLREIALRVAREMPWPTSGCHGDQVVEFAARFLAALPKPEPVAFCDDAVIAGKVGNAASRAAKEYWEKGSWSDRESAKRLCNPLYTAPPIQSAQGWQPIEEYDWSDFDLAQMILSDCGISNEANGSLAARIADRIAKHKRKNTHAQPDAARDDVRDAERMNADTLREPINGTEWRVEWWNESCRMMLPSDMILDCFQAYKNGTLQLTLKKRAAIAAAKGEK